MLAAMAKSLVAFLPRPAAGHMPLILGLALGAAPRHLAQAAVPEQMTTGFPVSPLTPATFPIVGLAGIELGEHRRFTMPSVIRVDAVNQKGISPPLPDPAQTAIWVRAACDCVAEVSPGPPLKRFRCQCRAARSQNRTARAVNKTMGAEILLILLGWRLASQLPFTSGYVTR